MTGAIERIDAGPSQLRPELLEQACECESLHAHVLGQRVKLRLQFIADLDNPIHILIMPYIALCRQVHY